MSGIPRTLRNARQNRRPLHLFVSDASNIAKRMALFALRFYKVYLSVIVGGTCRFEPTCSVYAYQAIERFGVLRGSWFALKRLLRCQPLSRRFGYDPVPELCLGAEIRSARHSRRPLHVHETSTANIVAAMPSDQGGEFHKEART